MSSVLEQAAKIAEEWNRRPDCATCSRNIACCTVPPRSMLRSLRSITEQLIDLWRPGEDLVADLAVSNLRLVAQLTECLEGSCFACPVFIERLQSDPLLAARIKEMMREWKA